MRMKPEHVSQLCQLMEQPHLTMRSQLILVRRFARHLNTERKLTRSYFKAEVKTAKAALPFTKRQLSKIEEVQRKAHKSFKSALLDIGAWVYQNDELLTKRYGFDGICDLLGVNPVHRAEVIEYAEDLGRAISAVAFVSGLEDSASRQSGRHPADWKDGPLFNVFMQMMMKAMVENRDKIPNPFAPGGPLYGVPAYYPHPDGTMARKSASLVVHNLDGSSRVIERKIDVKK